MVNNISNAYFFFITFFYFFNKSLIMNFNIKKIFILVFLIFLLSSCFWKSSEEKQELEKNEKVSELEKSEIIKKKILDVK